VDAADYDGSGRPSLVIGNFSNEMMALYHNEGTGLFIDEAPTSGVGRASLLTLNLWAVRAGSLGTPQSRVIVSRFGATIRRRELPTLPSRALIRRLCLPVMRFFV